MRFAVPTIILASSAVINAAAVPSIEDRGFLGDIVGSAESAIDSISSQVASALTAAEKSLLGSEAASVASAFGDLLSILGAAEDSSKTILCAFESYLGLKKLPNTNGIEWYEDAEWVANFLVTNAVAEYAKTKLFTNFETEIQLLEKGGASFIGGVASSLGLNGTYFNETALDGVQAIQSLIEGVAVTAVDDLGNLLTQLSPSKIVQSFIGKAILAGEKSFSSLLDSALHVSGSIPGVDVALPFVCNAANVLFTGATTLEACSYNISIVNQVLSELEILSQYCTSS